jgi:hypothetical protein
VNLFPVLLYILRLNQHSTTDWHSESPVELRTATVALVAAVAATRDYVGLQAPGTFSWCTPCCNILQLVLNFLPCSARVALGIFPFRISANCSRRVCNGEFVTKPVTHSYRDFFMVSVLRSCGKRQSLISQRACLSLPIPRRGIYVTATKHQGMASVIH